MRTCFAVLVGLSCLSAGLRAQEERQSEPARPITEAADRIAQQLWPAPRVTNQGTQVTSELDENGRPRFRSGVSVTQFKLPPPWWDRDSASSPRPIGGSIYHQEFLAAVTPLAFRSSTLYPMGISSDPGAMINSMKAAWRSWQEQRARERVERELAEFLAAADH